MTEIPPQLERWKGDFGKNYTQRNFPSNLEGFERHHRKRFGLTRFLCPTTGPAGSRPTS